ncbi:MFS transporter [Sulfolobus sp. E11-6]|uniref:MFS transporter n=1 Tax=Sulfolobus sp. E11-6 TaxID=2663020 RepID=UPI001297D5C2|nr:MFS transporter [Sulfolobus sp. E11-6]
MIASVAATVWPSLFYPKSAPTVGVAASIATYASAFFSRPIGALLFGHYGDKLGRKPMLIWTLGITSLGMVGLALTPTYAQIGLVAPILLLIFRLIEGIGLGGEWGGAASIITEFSLKSGKVGYWTSWIQATTAFGIVLSIVGTLILRQLLPPIDFLNYGWRILIGVGAVMLVIGAIVRYYIFESPLFQKILKEGKIERAPISLAFKSDWKKIVLSGLCWPFIVTLVAIEMYPTGLSYMLQLKTNLLTAYSAILVGNLVQASAIILGGILSDRIGKRKTILLISNILSLIASIIFFPLLNFGDIEWFIIAYSFLGLSIGIGFGTVAALLTELYPTRYRYTASGFSFQLGGIIAGIYSSLLLPTVILVSGGLVRSWPLIDILAISVCLISLITNLLLKETEIRE